VFCHAQKKTPLCVNCMIGIIPANFHQGHCHLNASGLYDQCAVVLQSVHITDMLIDPAAISAA